jgi:hypothetical protein
LPSRQTVAANGRFMTSLFHRCRCWRHGALPAPAVSPAVIRDRNPGGKQQNWPKALGESIAASDVLLLLWSGRAAASDFVELEWCTALALKKTILPCLIDTVPLPASLSAIQSTHIDEVPEAARRAFGTLANETERADQTHTEIVIRHLAGIGGRTPSEVLQQAKAAFSQDRWTVQGPVYQAGGDIHITSPPSPKKTRLERWQAWVAIVAGILTAISLGLALVRSYAPSLKGPPTDASVQEQSLAGSVWDDAGEPLPGVQVSLLLGDKVLPGDNTDGLGRFSFRVTAPLEADVTLVAQRDG